MRREREVEGNRDWLFEIFLSFEDDCLHDRIKCRQLNQHLNCIIMTKASADKYVGCLLGGAIGDALGAPVEFMSLNAIRSRYGINGVADFVEFPGNAGEFTDDTQMTLFTAEGLLLGESLAAPDRKREVVINTTYQSYLRWLRTQDTDPVKENIKHRCDDQETGWLIRQKGLFKNRAPGITCQNALRSGKAGTVSDPVNNSKGCGKSTGTL